MEARLIVSLAVGMHLTVAASGYAQVVEYAFTGEVIAADGSPGSLYASVEGGAAANGLIRWDLAAAPSGVLNLFSYDMPEGFSAIEMTVDATDPFGETSIPNDDSLAALVVVADNFTDDASVPPADSLLIVQSVQSSAALGDAEMLLFFTGEPSIWSDAVLPTSLDLADWDAAVLLLESELGFVDVGLTSLRLVPETACGLLGLAGLMLTAAGGRRSGPRSSPRRA